MPFSQHGTPDSHWICPPLPSPEHLWWSGASQEFLMWNINSPSLSLCFVEFGVFLFVWFFFSFGILSWLFGCFWEVGRGHISGVVGDATVFDFKGYKCSSSRGISACGTQKTERSLYSSVVNYSPVSLLLKCFSHNSVLKIKFTKNLETQRLCWGIWCPLCRSLFPEPQRLELVTCSSRDKTFQWSPHVSCFQFYSLKIYQYKENFWEWSSDENQHLEEKYRQKNPLDPLTFPFERVTFDSPWILVTYALL